MPKDLSKLYYEIISGPEFIAFKNRVGGSVNSSPTQIKRCTIQIEDIPGKHRWLFFSNGYVREQENTSYDPWRAKVLAKPPEGWDKDNVTYDMMVELISKAHKRIDKREQTLRSRATKMEKNAPYYISVLFDPELWTFKNQAYHSKFNGFWIKGEWKDVLDRMYYNRPDGEQGLIRK